MLSLLSVEALTKLDVVIGHPNAQQSENTMAYDNAVSALGKICQFHRDSIDAGRVIIYRPPISTFFTVTSNVSSFYRILCAFYGNFHLFTVWQLIDMSVTWKHIIQHTF